ncbi:MAG TPA: DMT family transporter [Candidatus Thermoplasmatota archaeon]|nr:DMT family transporter [Candidatus Thermoplasmatota archaeon]
MRAADAAGLSFVLVSFALNSVVTRLLVAGGLLDPGLATAVRFVAGAAALALLALALGRASDARPRRRSALPAVALGAYALLISYGYAHVGAAAGTLVFYACVLATMTLGGALVHRLAPPGRALAGGLLGLAGVGVLALGRVEGTTPLGVLLLAGTGVAWGIYSLQGRGHADAFAFSAGNFALLALALLPFAAWRVADGAPWTGAGLALAAGMGAITTALAYVAWYRLQPRLAPAQAAAYQMAIPVLTAGMAVLALDEPFTPRLVGAATLVLAGMALASWPRRARATAGAAATEA